ncbi:HDOD domain-containing protein [Rhabdochromatium marinum]|uniref:HDOD domain-containing protein n=1 Tax=Rhabdochromatium marinum TaxID=48729 RepID=UPI0019050710|nr:HDOD domain-containing protein [Rhabdochromatium marinum]MBK1649405.1 hypothetical protein [Rhabdochromatium marinum]
MSAPFRLLIAENNPQFVHELEQLLRRALPDAILERATDGQDAWKRVRNDSFDMVIADWNLPLLSGGDLLLKLRGHYKTRDLPFMMLTGRADRISVMYALRAGVTAYIIKPFERGYFIQRVDQLLALRREALRAMESESGPNAELHQKALRQRSLNDVLRRIRRGDIVLPVLPEIAFKVNEVARKSNATIQEIASLISRDGSVSSKLLAISNSGYYRGVRRFNTTEEAVIRLGFRQTQNYVMTITTRGLFEAEDPFFSSLLKQLWVHSLATAAAARAIARQTRKLNPDVLYGKGFLHDIGKLLLLHTVAGMPQSHLGDDGIYEVLDTMHTEYGAALLKHWKFTPDAIDICLQHHDLGDTSQWPLDLLTVSFANVLVRELGWSLHRKDDAHPAQANMALHLGLNENAIAAVLEETREYVNKTKLMIWGSLEAPDKL